MLPQTQVTAGLGGATGICINTFCLPRTPIRFVPTQMRQGEFIRCARAVISGKTNSAASINCRMDPYIGFSPIADNGERASSLAIRIRTYSNRSRTRPPSRRSWTGRQGVPAPLVPFVDFDQGDSGCVIHARDNRGANLGGITAPLQ